MLFDAGDRMWRCVLFPQTSGQQILEQERVSDARGSLRGHGARRSTDAGCSCWRGPLQAEVTVPGDVLGWTPGGVHRRGPVGIGKPGAEALGSFARWDFPLPPRGMSRSTSGGPCPPRYPPRACGEVEWAIFDASGVVRSLVCRVDRRADIFEHELLSSMVGVLGTVAGGSAGFGVFRTTMSRMAGPTR